MRRFTEGLETGDLTMWAGSSASTNYAIAASSVVARRGTYSLRANRTAGFSGAGCYVQQEFGAFQSGNVCVQYNEDGGAGGQGALLRASNTTDYFWMRGYIYFTTLSTGTTAILKLVDFLDSGNASVYAPITMRANGVIVVGATGGVPTPSWTPSTATWYRYVIFAEKTGASTGNVVVSFFLENSNVLVYARSNAITVSTHWERMRVGLVPSIFAGSGNVDVHYDDFAINDWQPPINNGCPAPGGCYGPIYPTGDGTPLEFTPSTGTAHWSLIDDWVDATDYVLTPTNTTTNEDNYDYQKTSTSPFPSPYGSVAYANAITLTNNIPAANAAYSPAITLAEDVDLTETDITINDDTDVNANDIIYIDGELMKVTAKAADVLTVIRGVGGSTATLHISGQTVLQAGNAFVYSSAGDDAVVGHCLLVDSEQMSLIAEDATNNIFTVLRAANGTSAAAHAAASAVTRMFNITCVQLMFYQQEDTGVEGLLHKQGMVDSSGNKLETAEFLPSFSSSDPFQYLGVCLGATGAASALAAWTTAEYDNAATEIMFRRSVPVDNTNRRKLFSVRGEVEDNDGLSLPNPFAPTRRIVGGIT